MKNKWKMNVTYLATLIMLISLFAAPRAFAEAVVKEKVIIFHAGSLEKPFARIEKDFEEKFPNLDVVREAGGSRKMARMVSEKNRPCDIMASADYKVIDNLLIPDHASWNIRFAANQIVLCYTDTSKYGSTISPDNWREILAKKDISWAHTDPNLDPCGYRSLMVLQLAEKFYNEQGLYEKLIAARPAENVMNSAAEMVGLLKSGELDYAWEYLSVAVQNNLKYIALPTEINLGDYAHTDFYKQATVKVTGKEAGTWTTLNGDSITYGITMIDNCPNKEGAVAFLKYLLDPEKGMKILGSMGQVPFIPSRVGSVEMKDSLPVLLTDFVQTAR